MMYHGEPHMEHMKALKAKDGTHHTNKGSKGKHQGDLNSGGKAVSLGNHEQTHSEGKKENICYDPLHEPCI